MNKICVVQFDNRKNEFNTKVSELSKKYCNFNNYDYYFEQDFDLNSLKTQDLIEFVNDEKNQNYVVACYYKFNLLKKYLDMGYEYVIIIDSDIIFSNPYKKIEEFLDDEHLLYLSIDEGIYANNLRINYCAKIVQDYCYKKHIRFVKNFDEANLKFPFNNSNIINEFNILATNPNGLNLGIMIYKNSSLIYELIKDIYPYLKISENIINDQGAMGILLKTKKYKNIFKRLPDCFQGNSRLSMPEFKYNEDINFVNHIYGSSYDIRMKGLIQVINNKWWKKFNKQNN